MAQDKKAEDAVVLDMAKISSIADYFVILSGNSTRQVKAIADYIGEQLKGRGERIWHIEGSAAALWVLLDCADVVVHVFQAPTRRFYDLERLWADAPQLKVENHVCKHS
ncbi:ribosome silencing factor [Candidatus Omnitrophota bacterium]